MKLRSRYFLLLLYLFIHINSAAKNFTFKKGYKIKCIVIDPGHGGRDPGAVGKKKNKEKDITLKVALLLKKKIKNKFSDIRLILTREKDEFVSLADRNRIARSNGSLFISLHCNAVKYSEHSGSEIYVMSLVQNQKTSESAKRENSVIALEKSFKQRYKDFTTSTVDGKILFLVQNSSSHKNSLKLATEIKKEFFKIGKKPLKICQDRLYLFFRLPMPSILIELGYITNIKEEEYMASLKGQEDLANAIFLGICEYKKKVEG